VHVQVIDLLAPVRVAVDDQPVAVLGDAFASRQVTRHRVHMADQGFVGVGDVVGRGNRLVGHDQYMHRRARVDIPESGDLRVTINYVGGQLAGNDPLKQRGHDRSLDVSRGARQVAPGRAASVNLRCR